MAAMDGSAARACPPRVQARRAARRGEVGRKQPLRLDPEMALHEPEFAVVVKTLGREHKSGAVLRGGVVHDRSRASEAERSSGACDLAIKLFAYDTPNGRKISVALEEMALPYEVHVVDITKGEQHAAEFARVSPNHKIPAIIDPEGPDGAPISVFESGAILLYLGQKTGKFWPAGWRAQVSVLEWLMWQMGNFGPFPGQVHHFRTVQDEAARAYGLARYGAETRRLYAVADQRLGEVEYFAGDLSVADFAILGWAWRHPRHFVDLADYPNVQRWYAGLMARPGVARGFAVALSRPAN
jgi:GST-like protein